MTLQSPPPTPPPTHTPSFFETGFLSLSNSGILHSLDQADLEFIEIHLCWD